MKRKVKSESPCFWSKLEKSELHSATFSRDNETCHGARANIWPQNKLFGLLICLLCMDMSLEIFPTDQIQMSCKKSCKLQTGSNQRVCQTESWAKIWKRTNKTQLNLGPRPHVDVARVRWLRMVRHTSGADTLSANQSKKLQKFLCIRGVCVSVFRKSTVNMHLHVHVGFLSRNTNFLLFLTDARDGTSTRMDGDVRKGISFWVPGFWTSYIPHVDGGLFSSDLVLDFLTFFLSLIPQTKQVCALDMK